MIEKVKINCDTAPESGFVYCSSVERHSKVFVRDNVFVLCGNESGMKLKTVVIEIL